MSEDRDIIETANGVYLDFTVLPGGSSDLSVEAINRIVETCREAVEAEGYILGENYLSEETDHGPCLVCHGTGMHLPVPEELVCPTCEGTGILEADEEELRDEWEDLYSDSRESGIKLKLSPATAEEILEAAGVTEEQKDRARRAVEGISKED